MPRNLLPFMVVLPSLAYSLISLLCALKFFKGQGSGVRGEENACNAPSPPAVSILKPVKGMDGESYDNFASFCRQEYPGKQQLVFAAASPDDPVITVIRKLIEVK